MEFQGDIVIQAYFQTFYIAEPADNLLCVGHSLRIVKNRKTIYPVMNALDEFDPNTETIDFREDIFKQIVIKADVYEDAHIVYELSIGIIYTVLIKII